MSKIETVTDIQKFLFSLQDKKYRDFQSKLIPTINANTVIGVRTPQLRDFAKKVFSSSCKTEFLKTIPHKYFDENQLHAFVISLEKDFCECISFVEKFLPYVDNWATSDQLSPKVFKRNKKELLPYINKWINSSHIYSVRFAISMLMHHFLDEDFKSEYMEKVVNIRSQEYYINMMRAWYMATALAKQYGTAVEYIENKKLDEWTHKKTIQKAVESYRITDDKKEYLRSLK